MLQTLWEGGGVDSVSILRTLGLSAPIEIQSTTERPDRSDRPACVVCIRQYRVIVVQCASDNIERWYAVSNAPQCAACS